jgi:hypothetical protein
MGLGGLRVEAPHHFPDAMVTISSSHKHRLYLQHIVQGSDRSLPPPVLMHEKGDALALTKVHHLAEGCMSPLTRQ